MSAVQSLSAVIERVSKALTDADLHYGHGTDNPHDEACWLVSATLGLPPDFSDQDDQPVSTEQWAAIEARLAQRIASRQPLAYILGEAWFAGLRFEVNDAVLVPRSPLAELIVEGFAPWLAPGAWSRAVEIGTGSGCIAAALAWHHPECQVDALDISPSALALAQRNVDALGLASRVRLIESDLWSAVPGQRYDLIISNPPYVPEASMKGLPAEYLAEPRLGLVAGADGLSLVKPLLLQAFNHLNPGGIVVVEVGEAAEALEAWLIELGVSPLWLEFAHGGEGVCLLDAQACEQLARQGGKISD
jgi:ribosomal protein L3 glutamine methyltransferase